MGSHEDNLDEALRHVNPAKRAFLRALVAGAGFGLPTVASFSMKGISTYEVHAQGGSNVTLSDRHRKEAFAPVDYEAVLDRVAQLPIEMWQYKGQASRHIGPMAQDFAAAFRVGPDDRHIDLLDASGVALAAIRALAERVQSQNAELAELRTTIAQVQQRA